jgi:ribonuclease P protein component
VSSSKTALPYPASARIKKREDFVGLQEKGSKVSAKNLLLIYLPSAKPSSRFGVVVTRKLDTRATVRNRIRRKIREVLRLNRCKLQSSFDILVIARRGIADCSYQEIEKQILDSLRRAKCI